MKLLDFADLPTEDEIIERIKNDKVPMNKIPGLVLELVEEIIEDVEEDYHKEISTDLTYEQITFAIQQLEECMNDVDIYTKLHELRMLQCRHMPITIKQDD